MTLAESVTNWSFIPVLDDMTPDQLILVARCLSPESYGPPSEEDFLTMPDWALLLWTEAEEERARERDGKCSGIHN